MADSINSHHPQGELFNKHLSRSTTHKQLTLQKKNISNIQPLHTLIDMQKDLCQLSIKIDWQEISDTFGNNLIFENESYSLRKLASFYFLKKKSMLNDYALIRLWEENPYWQFFSGETHYQHKTLISHKLLVFFRNFIGESGEQYLTDIANKHGLMRTPLQSEPLFAFAKKLSKTTRNDDFKSKLNFYSESLKWYQDHLFYIYILSAIGFWIVYSFVFPTQWPKNWLTLNQFQNLLYVVLFYPILEEISFRYGLQGWLHYYKWGKTSSFGLSIANIITSLVFSILHVIVRPVDEFAFAVIIPSLIFGFFKDRHGHIYSCTVLHIFYNLGIFMLLIIQNID